MNPTEIGVRYDGYTDIVIAENQPEYLPLPALVKIDDPRGKIITAWELTDTELLVLIQTKRLYITYLTFNQPLQPTLPSVNYKEALDI